MSGSIDDLANKKMIIIDDTIEIRYHTDFMLHMMPYYLEFNTLSTRTKFNNHAEEFNENFEELHYLFQ
ncbi:MAG: hypothetical protein ACFFDF_13070 [Candidatus Odinarchaeota archaeon]